MIAAITESGLRGRGGAGFPTGTQVGARTRAGRSRSNTSSATATKAIPAPSWTALVLESDPHRVLEGLAIAAYAIGAAEGYFYIRAEYPLAVRHMRAAIQQADERGLPRTRCASKCAKAPARSSAAKRPR